MNAQEPSRDPLRVTDHAVLRYLERGMGLNVEIVREHIAAVCAGPAAFGAVCVRSESLRFEIVHGAVTTVAPDQQLPSNISRDRARRRIEREARA
jgi:hypothetical protein